MQWAQLVAGMLLGLSTSELPAADDDGRVLNPDTRTYDYHPSVSQHADGSMWVAWHGYAEGRDRILARYLSAAGTPGPLHEVSAAGSVHGPPVVLSEAAGAVSVVWSARRSGRWHVLLRTRSNAGWNDARVLSSEGTDAILPAAVSGPDKASWVVWSERTSRGFRVRGCRVVNGQPESSFDVSKAGADAFRPTVVSTPTATWVFWDEYDGGDYSVRGRIVWPEPSPIEDVSPPGAYCLTPTAVVHNGRPVVAWLRKQDTIGGPGVISQWHTLEAATRSGSGWELIRDGDGNGTAAELTQGLVAKIQPRVVATGGYLGPRTRPQLLSRDGQVWLFWERKSDHRGSTPFVTGDLAARPMHDGRWLPPVVLSTGRLDYHVVHPHGGRNKSVQIVASRSPSKGLRTYESFSVDLKQAAPFRQERWPGWNPVELPITSEVTPRQTVSIGDRTYQLFWADLHCHNGLTADAEGEPDEMHNYARDRAALDVVVFTNNDYYNVPLTEYDFALGELYATVWSERGRSGHSRPFLSLPGFEWTSRVPGVASAALADPGNWTPPYRNRSFPNHRSVIYPPGGGPLVHFTEVANDIDRLNQAVARANGITLSQHNAFRLSNHPVEVGFELTSGWSNYILQKPSLFHGPLNRGAKLGFTASGDTHRRAPGLSGALTGIYAESLSAEGILDALRQRRCFATMGSRIFLDARANHAFMGQEVHSEDGTVDLRLSVVGTRDIVRATLIRDGKAIHTAAGKGGKHLTVRYSDSGLSGGRHWYYWEVYQERDAPALPGNLMVAHGHIAWSSPHFVTVK